MALPYSTPDPATGQWDPFALKRNLEYLDQQQVNQGAERLSVQVGPVGTSGASETVLFGVNLIANKLALDGQRLFFRAWGTTAANGNNKFWRVYWGSSLIFIDNGTHNNVDWFLEGIVLRTGTSTQETLAVLHYQGAVPHVDFGATSEDNRTANTFGLTGDGDASNDIVGRGFELVWYP